jgi:phosphopantetheine adenylyltransferase
MKDNFVDKLEELINKSQKMQETTGKKVARSFIYKTPPDGIPPETFAMAMQLNKKRKKRGKK